MNANTQTQARGIPAFPNSLWLVALLLVCHLLLGLSAIARKSATSDEGVHLLGGLSYWTTGDYRVNPESGNWPQRWAALPVWVKDRPSLPIDIPVWQSGNEWDLTKSFFYESGNDADAMFFLGRAMIGLLSAALGAIVYFWSRQLFGPVGGLISLTLYVFSPTMLANGFLVTADLASALFFSAAAWALWALLHRISPLTITACGFTSAGLLLSKFSGVLIAPMGLLLLFLRLCNPQPVVLEVGSRREIHGRLKQLTVLCGTMLVEVVIVGLLIWASYGFRYGTTNSSATTSEVSVVSTERLPKKLGAVGKAIQFIAVHRLLPEPFLYGLAYTVASTETRRAFLNGEFRVHGWIGFFPYCLAVKTPPEVFLILMLAAAGAWFRHGKVRGYDKFSTAPEFVRGMYSLSPLLVLLSVYWIASLCSHLNIGQRHLLPTYPPMFILAGAAAVWLQFAAPQPSASWQTDDRNQASLARPAGYATKLVLAVRVLLVGSVVLAAIEAVWIWPNYLAYFNALAGGPSHGYRHLVDSSLDWGQDLKELKHWLDAHSSDGRDPLRLYLAYFGPTPPEYYGINATILSGIFDPWQPHVPQPLTGGTYCISATMLQGIYESFPGKWNAQYEYLYQQLCQSVLDYRRGGGDLFATSQIVESIGAQNIDRVFQAYEQLRAARLYSFLKEREPDDNVCHSILIYRLTDDDLRNALEGSPVEMLPDCEPDAKETLPIKMAR
jgi:hypothetical protein